MVANYTTMKVELPRQTFEQLQTFAQYQQRSVSEVVEDFILQSLSALPQDVKDELTSFVHLSDDALWALARSTLSMEQQRELAHLNAEAKSRALSEVERKQQQALIDKYDRMLVRRAESARLLMVRGYDLSDVAVLNVE